MIQINNFRGDLSNLLSVGNLTAYKQCSQTVLLHRYA